MTSEKTLGMRIHWAYASSVPLRRSVRSPHESGVERTLLKTASATASARTAWISTLRITKIPVRRGVPENAPVPDARGLPRSEEDSLLIHFGIVTFRNAVFAGGRKLSDFRRGKKTL